MTHAMTRALPPCAAAVLAATFTLAAGRADAQVERYAVVIGNNQGAADEAPLRWAEDDAAKIAHVLRELGGFRAENLLLLRGESAEAIRRALIATNDRIRTRPAAGGRAMLLVYFSGHADAAAMHLGASTLEHAELRQLVRGSAAAMRLLIVDACRSGALTRVKGGRDAPPFAITLDAAGMSGGGEGAVFLTSSAANEDAQESDDIKGSFFTHALASALLGAGDTDGDGRVMLEEAYRYAYESTLRASSRTLAGTQHPTFQYDLRGQGQIVLTTLNAGGGARGVLAFPPGRGYLVMKGDRSGSVVAEIGPYDRARRLSVPPDRYFVRGRGPGYLLEGTVALAAGDARTVEDRDLERLDYARLVRKGRAEAALTQGPQAGYQLRSPLGGATLCQGVFAGYAVETRHLTVLPRIAACHSTFQNGDLSADADELGMHLMVAHAWDLPVVTVELGVATGVSMLRQTFGVRGGTAPDRHSLAGQVGAGLALVCDLPRGLYLRLDANAESYVFRQQDTAGHTALTGVLVGRGGLGIGKRL
jgi:Caspase domain